MILFGVVERTHRGKDGVILFCVVERTHRGKDRVILFGVVERTHRGKDGAILFCVFDKSRLQDCWLVSSCLEPSQPQRITSGLKACRKEETEPKTDNVHGVTAPGAIRHRIRNLVLIFPQSVCA